MQSKELVRFLRGLLLHPSEFIRRTRELRRISAAPDMDSAIPMNELADVTLVPVQSDEGLQKRLVAMYADNPSPYVFGPKTDEALREETERGMRYFLVANNDGEFVGARAFDPGSTLLQSTVTDFRHRGHGYQVAAGYKLMMLLADEGYAEVRTNVMRSNTRMQRVMIARGWKMSPDAENDDLIRGVLNLKKLKANQQAA